MIDLYTLVNVIYAAVLSDSSTIAGYTPQNMPVFTPERCICASDAGHTLGCILTRIGRWGFWRAGKCDGPGCTVMIYSTRSGRDGDTPTANGPGPTPNWPGG